MTDSTASAQASLDDALAEAYRRRDDGTEAALNAAHGWARLAAEEAIRDLAATREPFHAGHVRQRVGPPLGCSPNVMGALFRSAAARGEIVAVGWATAPHREGHGRAIRVWVGAA